MFSVTARELATSTLPFADPFGPVVSIRAVVALKAETPLAFAGGTRESTTVPVVPGGSCNPLVLYPAVQPDGTTSPKAKVVGEHVDPSLFFTLTLNETDWPGAVMTVVPGESDTIGVAAEHGGP